MVIVLLSLPFDILVSLVKGVSLKVWLVFLGCSHVDKTNLSSEFNLYEELFWFPWNTLVGQVSLLALLSPRRKHSEVAQIINSFNLFRFLVSLRKWICRVNEPINFSRLMHLTCFMFFDHIKARAVVTCLASKCR